MSDNPRSPETRVQHPPEIELPADNPPLNLPIYQNVKWQTDAVEETSRIMRGERAGYFYSRIANPTVRQLERLLASLQGRDDALVTSSGVNVIAQTLLALTKTGDHLVCFAESYGPTRQVIRYLLGRFGVTHTLLPLDDLDALERILRDRPTRAIVFESPTNPINKVADIAAITTLAREHGALTVLDNTAAGFHQHGEFPIDLYLHSLTKYATGAGEVMGGAVIGSQAALAPLREDFKLLGAALDPHCAFSMLQGLKSYFVRYRAQCAAAQRIAEHLQRHPQVARVRYPGLIDGPQFALARRQMRDFGTVVTFDHRGGLETGRRFAEQLQLFARAPSFGSMESLVMPPQWLQPRDLDGEARQASDIGPGTIRLSIGLESPDELIADLDQALSRSVK
ncbi:MAG: trans-sulfuration enzyme family protein [Steroidobacteraceae bacterium]